jgi:uracil permease
MNGVGTLLYIVMCKGQIPAYLGSSFAFISPTLAVIAADPSLGGYQAAQAGFIAFGIFFVIVSQIVRIIGTQWIDVVFPPAAMGALVMVIGLELAPVAAQMSGFTEGPATNHSIGRDIASCVSLTTLAVCALGSVFFRGFFAVVPLLVGILAGYCLSMFFGLIDFAPAVNAPWFEVPKFTAPTFNLTAVLMILPVSFVVLAEHIGHLVVTGHIVNRDLMREPGLHRSLLGDGISNILSGLVGATPNTTYGENIGVMAMTKVFSVYVIGVAALLAISISFCGKATALIRTIPTPVMGGACVLLFGVIAAAGVRMLVERRVDYSKSSNLVLTAVVLVIGVSGASLTLFGIEMRGMVLASVMAALCGIMFSIAKVSYD